MRWRQFLTPVKSLDAKAVRKFMAEKSLEDFTLLDVRQPAEYARGHIPGSKLIPLGELGDRLGELDSDKPVLVY